MNLKDFDYELPQRLIAQQPAPVRDHSRLMVVNRNTGVLEHRVFSDFPEYLQPKDVLVLNETKVMPARLIGKKETGGKVEILLVREKQRKKMAGNLNAEAGPQNEEWLSEWECLARGPGRLRSRTRIFFNEDLFGKLEGKTPAGLWTICLRTRGGIEEALSRNGFPPLPPYIRRNGDWGMRALDLERYQTVYARKEGAIAAPTAGLHFTDPLLQAIRAKGVLVHPVTLHVGIGTFMPVKQEEIEEHHLEAEIFEVYPETARAVNEARAAGKKVIAIGTTVTRALESCVKENGKIQPRQGETGLFIFPGYRFRAVDALITNFHLPRSTLLMLVFAFAGGELMRRAYEEAIKENYRFYSYGDAMLIE